MFHLSAINGRIDIRILSAISVTPLGVAVGRGGTPEDRATLSPHSWIWASRHDLGYYSEGGRGRKGPAGDPNLVRP